MRFPRVRIATGLLLIVGLLVLISGATALGVGLWSARTNTLLLLRDEAQLISTLVRQNIDQRLQPAEATVNRLAEQLQKGLVDTRNDQVLQAAFRGAVAGTPYVNAVLLIHEDGRLLRALKIGAKIETDWLDMSRYPETGEIIQSRSGENRAIWGELLRPPESNLTLINVSRRVNLPTDEVAFVMAAVPIFAFSAMVADIGKEMGGNAFVVYGDLHVLAHRNLTEEGNGYGDRSPPLARISEIDDPVLQQLFKPNGNGEASFANRAEQEFTEYTDIYLVHVPSAPEPNSDTIEYAAIMAPLTHYGAVPWTVGVYVETAQFDDPFARIRTAGIWGAGILAVALLSAWLLARVLSRPWQRLSDASENLSRLTLDRVDPLPHSYWREIDDAAGAFNRMLAGLKWFETYVPKRLVRRLMADSDTTANHIQNRDVTVLFTDIAGFTGQSEALSADATAAFLNNHFALLHRLIDAEDGTVDKFIGDSVMAFWGAPEQQNDHATRACRTALAIRRALAEGGDAGSVMGNYRLRIGIHTGNVVVGNIGAPERMNYTIVGDTVNIANRLEQLCKDVGDGHDHPDGQSVKILASGATIKRAGYAIEATSLGLYELRGRRDAVDVYSL